VIARTFGHQPGQERTPSCDACRRRGSLTATPALRLFARPTHIIDGLPENTSSCFRRHDHGLCPAGLRHRSAHAGSAPSPTAHPAPTVPSPLAASRHPAPKCFCVLVQQSALSRRGSSRAPPRPQLQEVAGARNASPVPRATVAAGRRRATGQPEGRGALEEKDKPDFLHEQSFDTPQRGESTGHGRPTNYYETRPLRLG
jgi:hypothetical protein